MIIVDKDLKKLIHDRTIVVMSFERSLPFNPEAQIGPGSIDLRLSPTVRRYKEGIPCIDLSTKGDTELVELDPEQDFVIQPGELWLATTLEVVMLPPNIAGLITGRSSIARLGLLVQCSQDFIQPGHAQLIPLQLINTTTRPIKIKPHLSICQLVLLYTTSNASIPYSQRENAKYKGELLTPEPSKIGLELGLDKPSDLKSPSELNPQLSELSETVSRFQAQVQDLESKQTKVTSRLKNVLSAAYLVLGASISAAIPEINVQPFPSVKLQIALGFVGVSLILIFLGMLREE
jgi:dCTP deaminase